VCLVRENILQVTAVAQSVAYFIVVRGARVLILARFSFDHDICNGFGDHKMSFIFEVLVFIFSLIHLREQDECVMTKIKLLVFLRNTFSEHFIITLRTFIFLYKGMFKLFHGGSVRHCLENSILLGQPKAQEMIKIQALVVVHMDGVKRCFRTVATSGCIVHPPDDI
jgi:hypothetical protein